MEGDNKLDEYRTIEIILWSDETMWKSEAEINMERDRQGSRVVTATTEKIKEIMRMLRKQCVVCRINNVLANHKLSDCELIYGKCIQCQDK